MKKAVPVHMQHKVCDATISVESIEATFQCYLLLLSTSNC